MAAKKRFYRVLFHNHGRLYEVYAKGVGQSGLTGFVEMQGLSFGERSAVVVDPAAEALQKEFEGVERTHIPVHSVVRIDEVEKRGVAKIHPLGEAMGKVRSLPTPRAPAG